LIVRVKYSNNLPDIPFDLKFLTYPFESERFINYMPTSLERNYKFEVLTEHDLGVNIDLINRDLYQCDRTSTLDPADEKLLEEDTHVQQDTTRSKQHAKSVSWLRRSEYISTEQTRFQPQNMEKAEAKVGYNVKNSLKEETLYMDREQQIKAIEKTFADSNTPIKNHYCKPNVVPVDVYPVYPDFKNWKFPCAQVMFDADPSVGTKSLPNQMEEMSQAMIRGVMDESGEQFVAYFLPTDETMEKRRTDFSMERTYEDETEYEYKMAREYNWNVKSKLSKGYEENYFLVIRDEGVYYNELETRVRLSKRRQKIGAQSNTKLVVKHRPLNANEHKMQVAREKQLEPTGDEEEFESEPEEEEEKKNEDEDVEMKDSERKSRSRSRSKSGSRSGSGSDRSRSRSKSGSGSDRSRSRSRSGSRSSRSR
jgi:RNA polymerase II-associated factor 1